MPYYARTFEDALAAALRELDRQVGPPSTLEEARWRREQRAHLTALYRERLLS